MIEDRARAGRPLPGQRPAPRSLAFALSLGLALFGASIAAALEYDFVSTEIELSLRSDGKAEVFYRIEIDVKSGTMSGFYFQGEAFKPAWNMQRCYADLEDGLRVPLEIKDLGGGRYDVILAGDRRFSGKAYYVFNYAGDFAAAGLVGQTESPERGSLVYFDWSPVAWDEGLRYRSVRLILPVRVAGQTISADERAAVPVYTEPRVNQENRIDYQGVPGDDGRYFLSLLFYQDQPGAYQNQLLELYFDEAWLGLDQATGGRLGAGRLARVRALARLGKPTAAIGPIAATSAPCRCWPSALPACPQRSASLFTANGRGHSGSSWPVRPLSASWPWSGSRS